MPLVLVLASVKSIHVSKINFLVKVLWEYVSHHNVYIYLYIYIYMYYAPTRHLDSY